MNKQSVLYQELTQEELLRIMAAVFPGEQVTDFHLLSGGLFNTTYRVVTHSHDVVLRMGPVHRELLLPYEHTLMAAETAVNKLCLENGVPASVVVHLDTSKSIIDRDFMVVNHIDSIPLSDPSIPEEAAAGIQFTCGQLAHKIHSVTGNGFGRVSKVAAGKCFANWYDAVATEFADIFHAAEEYSLFDNAFRQRALAFVAGRKALLDTVTTPRLVHADLWAGNVLVCKQDSGYEVCAIIDGDRAFFGDPDFDLATPWLITPAFLSGYGEKHNNLSVEDTAKKNAVYALLLALHDAYVWTVEYSRPDIGQENIAAADKILHT